MVSSTFSDSAKLKQFRDLVEAHEANENAIQKFVEENTNFMPTPDLLNHQLHLNSVMAKFPIGDRSTDYAYLTKSTVEWRLVLVELEDSGKRIFKNSSKNHAFSAEFGDAVAQIDVWRDYLDNNLDRVREKLRPLMVPPNMAANKLSVRYLLVIGRSEELEHNEGRRLRLANYGAERNLTIWTYDTIIRQVENGFSDPKAVLRANSRGYLLQSVEAMPTTMFAYIKPEHLELSPAAELALRADKFDIDAWKGNKPLTINDRWTVESDPSLYEGLHPAAKAMLLRRRLRSSD